MASVRTGIAIAASLRTRTTASSLAHLRRNISSAYTDTHALSSLRLTPSIRQARFASTQPPSAPNPNAGEKAGKDDLEAKVESAAEASNRTEGAAAVPEGGAPTISTPPADSSSLPSKPQLTSTLASQLLADLPEPSTESSSGGARPRKRQLSSIERRRRQTGRLALVVAGLGTIALVVGAGRDWESEEEKQRAEIDWWKEESKEGGLKAWAHRAASRIWDVMNYFNKPAWETLLPPPPPPPHGQPYTLLIDLDGLLTTSVWTMDKGWRTAKRPGADYFLAYLSMFYEIVLFTPQHSYTADPIVAKIDPYGAYIPYRLYREATRFTNGHIVKDLSYLGRDLSKVVVLDTVDAHTELQPENAVILPRWDGDRKDDGLIRLIPFLEAIYHRDVKDVRPILQRYKGKDVALEYAKAEAEEKAKVVAAWEEKQSKYGKVGKFLGNLVGTGMVGQTTEGPPQTFIEQRRALAQKYYLEEQKYWKDNEEQIKQAMKEDEEKRQAEMRGSISSFIFGQQPDMPDQAKAIAAQQQPQQLPGVLAGAGAQQPK